MFDVPSSSPVYADTSAHTSGQHMPHMDVNVPPEERDRLTPHSAMEHTDSPPRTTAAPGLNFGRLVGRAKSRQPRPRPGPWHPPMSSTLPVFGVLRGSNVRNMNNPTKPPTTKPPKSLSLAFLPPPPLPLPPNRQESRLHCSLGWNVRNKHVVSECVVVRKTTGVWLRYKWYTNGRLASALDNMAAI